MTRALSVCALLLILAPLCRSDEPTETVIRLSVTPAAEPRPALKYQLLPPLADINPGNPILGYLKCFSEQNHFFFDKDMVAKREKWHDMPLKDLPLKEMRDYAKGVGPCGRADQAARLDTADWQILLAMRKDGINTLVSEMQQLRMLASALHVRLRLEIAEKRFDDAVFTLQTMFALTRHLGEHPTLIGDLVGLAIAMVTLEAIGEMVEQPGCPNVYWALVGLPSPLVDIRKGLQGERMLLDTELRAIDQREPMSDADIRKAVKSLQALNGAVGSDVVVSQWLAEKVKDPAYVGAANKRLIQVGIAEDRLKLFPPEQILLLDQKRTFEAVRDDEMKRMPLPFWQIEALAAANPPATLDAKAPFSKQLPYWEKVRFAPVRVEQRIALLRGVEALRLYAAEHQGKLPMKLDDIAVPVPVDPVTGRAFIYRLDNETASLQGTPPRGMEKLPHYKVRFEIKVAK